MFLKLEKPEMDDFERNKLLQENCFKNFNILRKIVKKCQSV